MNLWAWHNRNPYYENAFQVLDVDPTADRATTRSRIAARRKRISYDAKRFPLFGEVLSVARVNAAEEQLATPRTRIAAELLTHRPEAEGEDLADLLELLELSRSLSETTDSTEPHAPGAPAEGFRIEHHVLPTLLPNPAAKPGTEEPTA
ncbi:hypothetical protein [Nocardia jejuensis]|uniref:hypothetical protein n=1 Tax=Nocardia jejuensis TaxID=328049 RepID=UPI00082ED2A6|nr:hypothetical protein [Nocardia jejuensis]